MDVESIPHWILIQYYILVWSWCIQFVHLTSSYMKLAQYPVHYQIIDHPTSSGTSNSVYKLQHIPGRPISRWVMKCSVWVVKLLDHLAKHARSQPTPPHTSVWEPCFRSCHWPPQLTLHSLPRKTSYTIHIVNKWKSMGGVGGAASETNILPHRSFKCCNQLL